MVRIKSSIPGHRRKKRVLKKTKGQFGHRKNRFRQAVKSLIKGMVYSYRDRKAKKREFRRLWILRINAACRENGITYSRFIKGLSDAKVDVNRKVMADLAVTSPDAFKQLVKVATEQAPAKAPAKAAKKAKS